MAVFSLIPFFLKKEKDRESLTVLFFKKQNREPLPAHGFDLSLLFTLLS